MAHKIRIISVGKAHDANVRAAIEEYEKRLLPLKIEWEILPPKTEATSGETIASESKTILKNLKQAEYVFVLDERGTQQTSEVFSAQLTQVLATNKNVTIVIGGAYGVTSEVRERAQTVLSLSKMVLPHQLVRLLLIEQLYRAISISAGSKYHHS